jgi:hypothetical protein
MAEAVSKQDERKCIYRRIRGARWSWGRSALRLADDHLLLCDSGSGFVERYKRFYFRDIEAIIIRKTPNWIAAVAIWAFIAFCFFLVGISVGWNTFLEVMEGICGFFILRNVIRGPSSRTHIQTAVQNDVLPMVKRTRKARRVLRSLFPLIEQAQSDLEQVATSVVSQSSVTEVKTAAPAPSLAPASVSEEVIPIRRPVGWFHTVTFTIALLSGLMAIWEVNYSSTTSLVISAALFCLSTVCAVIALVLQAKRPVHPAVAVVTWLLVISCIVGAMVVNGVFTMLDSIAQAKIQADAHSSRPMIIHPLTPFRLRHVPGFASVLWVYGISSVILALLGLIFCLMPAPKKAAPPPLPQDQLT